MDIDDIVRGYENTSILDVPLHGGVLFARCDNALTHQKQLKQFTCKKKLF